MATTEEYIQETENISDEIKQKWIEAAKNRKKEIAAAIKIQSWYRGWRVRLNIQYLHQKAIKIQAWWKGYSARKIYVDRLRLKYYNKCVKMYNYKATLIQKTWRGYWSRLKKFDYYKLMRYVQFILDQNIILQTLSNQYYDDLAKIDVITKRRLLKELEEELLQRYHHLLRIHVIRGIYSLPCGTDLSIIEQKMKALIFHDPDARLKFKLPKCTCSDKTCPYQETILKKKKPDPFFKDDCELTYVPKLPPEVRKHCMWSGPIAINRKYTEDWVEHEKAFRVTRHLDPKPYQPEITLVGGYQAPQNLLVRKVDKTKHVSESEFQTLLPHGKIFDEYVKKDEVGSGDNEDEFPCCQDVKLKF